MNIALIGASNEPGSVGAVLAANLTTAGFAGGGSSSAAQPKAR